MRIYNSDFLILNDTLSKEPRYYLELSFDSDNNDVVKLTSHIDTDVPPGSETIAGVLRNLSGTSQEVDPIKASATIGDLNFSAVDIQQKITNTIHGRLKPVNGDLGNGLRGKRVRLFVGYKGLSYDKYEVPSGGTQIITTISYDMRSGTYSFKCSDIQRELRKTICDEKTTTLLHTITGAQTAVPINSTTGFLPVFHGSGYASLPNETVGYIDIEGEAIAWRNKLESTIQLTGSDISFNGNLINSVTTDLSVYANGQLIRINGSASNDGFVEISSTASNSLTTLQTLTNESSGNSLTLTADTQFYGCTRGALNTRPVPHIVSPNTEVSRRTPVKEIIYLELPAVKALYAFLTGILYNDGAVLPPHWHLGIKTEFVQTSSFVGIGVDWWDVEDDSSGVPSNFAYLSKTNGKSFVERELLLLLGAFMPVTSHGELQLRRMTYVGVDSSYQHQLTENNVVSVSRLVHDYNSVYNKFLLRWNWDSIQEKFTRSELLIDNDSILVHKDTDIYEMRFKGMHGATYTKARAHARRDSARDRYIGPPQRITVICSPEMNSIEVGDIVKLTLKNLQDFVEGGSINRSFEVQRVSIDWLTGRVTLKLFGSTQRPTPLPTIASTTVIPDANYISIGKDISSYTNGSDVSGTWVISSDSELHGGGHMGATEYATGSIATTSGSRIVTGVNTAWKSPNASNIEIEGTVYKIRSVDSDNQLTLVEDYPGSTGANKPYKMFGAVYYWDGDILLNSGVTLTIHDNVRIRFKGELIINGRIDGKGKGLPGGDPITANTSISSGEGPHRGIPGFIGNTRSQGAMVDGIFYKSIFSTNWYLNTVGTNSALPQLNIEFEDNIVTGLSGLDLRATSGSSGGASFERDVYNINHNEVLGGRGGYGGAPLILEGRGVNVGLAGSVDLGGGDGINGVSGTIYGLPTFSGHGGGGASAPLLIILDGSGAVVSGAFTAFTSISGKSTNGYIPMVHNVLVPSEFANATKPITSYYTGYPAQESKTSLYREIILSDDNQPQVDVPDIAENPLALNLSEGVSSKQSLNLAAIEVSVTPPSNSTSYYASSIYAREVGADAWVKVTTVIGSEERVVQVPNYNAIYEFTAVPISVTGVEASSGITESIAITSASKGTTITDGGHVKAGQIGYDNGEGFFIGSDNNIWKISIGNSVGNKLLWDGSDLEITGKIIATSGDIGGWIINADGFYKGNLLFDSLNSKIQAGPDNANYVRIDSNGIIGVDSVLGTTFSLPTNGDAPTFSSGIINSTVFNITSSGILETSSTAGDGSPNGQGVRINDAGIHGWSANDSVAKFSLDALTGKITAINADITGGGIVLDAGGAVKSIGKVVGGGSGLFLGYDGGQYQLDVGDHDTEKFIYFDGADLVVGQNTELLGSDSINNNTTYYNDTPWSTRMYFIGTISTPPTANKGRLTCAPTAVANQLSFAVRKIDSPVNDLTWNSDRILKTRVVFELNIVSGEAGVSIGGVRATSNIGIGFLLRGNTFYAVTGDGVSQTFVDTGLSILTGTKYLLEVTKKGGTVSFAVDGINVATITTTIPTGTASADDIYHFYAQSGAFGQQIQVWTSQIKFIQRV